MLMSSGEKRKRGLEVFLSQQHLCVGWVVFLHTLQLNTEQVQGWEGQRGMLDIPKVAF